MTETALRSITNSGIWIPMLAPLYINLYLRTIPELLVTSGISSGTPNNFRLTAY